MNRKAAIFAVLLLLVLAPVASAWSWNPATWVARAFKIGDAKDIDLNQQAIGNGFVWNITCGGNCTNFTGDNNKLNKSGDSLTGNININGYSVLNANAISKTPAVLELQGTGSTSAVGIGSTNLLFPVQATTASAPAYVLGGQWYDTTKNALQIGGASIYESVCTSNNNRCAINTTGYDLTNASNLTHGGFDIVGTTDITHATGAGTRLMWIAGQSAFRAGVVTGTEWDNANIGSTSTAFGLSPIANGSYSFASGQTTNAYGTASTAMGESTRANSYSFAVGSGAVATGTYATAIGWSATASATSSFAAGRNAAASALYSVAIGQDAKAAGQNTVAISLGAAAPSIPATNVLAVSGGTINLTDSGKGITLHSTSGYSHCITVADNGTLQVAANTTCT